MGSQKHTEDILREQISMLYQGGKVSVPVNIITSLILAALSWPALDHTSLIIWASAMVMLSILRLFSCFLYFSQPRLFSTHGWANTFVAGSVLTGLLWGSIIFLFPHQSTLSPYLLIVVIFIAGMTAGATSTSGTYFKASAGFVVPATAPPIAYFSMGSTSVELAISIVLIVYTAMLLRTSQTSDKTIHGFLEQRRLNRAQAAELHEQQELLQSVLDTIEVGVVVFDRDMKLTLWNNALTRYLNISPNWLKTKPTMEDFIRLNAENGDFGQGDIEELVRSRMKRFDDPQNITPHRFERTRPTGTRLEIMGNPMPEGGVVTTYTDVTERFLRLEKIRLLADHDSLTGLVNRPVFERRLRHAIASAKRSGNMVSIFYLDLDHFKDINDTMGHPTGDQLLKQVATRLKKTARETDTVARLGGDEFAIIGTHHSNVHDVYRFAERILDILSEPVEIGEQIVHTGASIGATIFPLDNSTPVELFSHADMALYKAKEAGRDRFALFDSHMNDELQDRKRIETELRHAIHNNEFVLYYQPQIDFETKAVIGAEALLRWQHPERGIVAPDLFLPIAETNRLINPIGNWVIEEACAFTNRINGAKSENFKVSINLSAVQFRSEGLQSFIMETMTKSGVTADQIELEITESMVITNVEDAIKTLRRFQSLGISVAIDDFGTGYSSMAYLKDFSANVLKIDRSFVSEANKRDENRKIIAGIISLGHSLGMQIVAEGVEDADQESLLQSLKCDFAQGYYYGRPMPEADFLTYLEERSSQT
ncbi:bifunctional diguanylate cyclase/phosphodiesterase [Kordiimonas sediminis]|uniref:Bifunctional diguanylate cyclase/phosphodiesterase n=1 Tax=Kordiimonas sediminis TaxID=1735581 RepID=A0A919AJQ9_9PROT|nr:EAL domain-containing protein [Kordiimonas sediminis]GHF13004.1 bifunctional diguanylate cyclase/phosphodiesterase [Kordiimonas sediminis]